MAALQAFLLALGADDLRVHQFQILLVLVHDQNHAAQDADLGGSQTQAAGLNEGVLHVVQQGVELGVKVDDGVANLGQSGIALLQNSLNHDKIPSFS